MVSKAKDSRTLPRIKTHPFGRMLSIEKSTYKMIRDSVDQARPVVDDVIDDAIFTLDPGGRVATWNAGAEGMFGYSSEAIVGQHFARFFEPIDIQHRRPQYLLELAALERIEEQAWRMHKDGSRFWAHAVLTAQHNERGELLGFVSWSRDLTAASLRESRFRNTEAQLNAFLKHGPAAMFIKDGAGRYVHVNEQFVREFGMPSETILGCTDAQLFSAELAEDMLANDALVLAQGVTTEFKQQRRRADRCYTNLVCKFPIEDDAGQIIGIGGTITDVTEQLRAAQAMQGQSLRQSLIAAFGLLALQNPALEELIAAAVSTIDKGLHPEFIRYLTLAADAGSLELKGGSGWSGVWADQVRFDAAIETGDRFTIGERETALIVDYANETRDLPSPVLRDHGIRSGAEVLVWGANGPYGLLGVYSSVADAFAQESVDFLQGIRNTLVAAIDRKTSEQRLAYLAQFDALTGLPNRNLYLERLGLIVRRTDSEQRNVGVLFVDLDRFKSVNDKLGHSGGDLVLTLVARRLQDCVRPSDTVARLSGDEFALLLDFLAKPHDASVLAERVLAALARPFNIDGQEIYVSASLGISISPGDGSNPDTLLKNADMAMYRAKQAGSNTYRFFFAEMNTRTAVRLQTEAELRGALARREFALHYQPKVDIVTGQISGFEALLRWNHPKRGLVTPAEFIPILEETGQINEVGQWVVQEACEQIRAWRLAGLRACPIAVNLSARQFNQNDLDSTIDKILQATQIDPNLLEFELTESILMSDSEDAVRVLDNMKRCGIRLSVDDFGTGYSSLAYLKRFPLDSLKIDRAFIRHITSDPGDATITTAIINLAHSLKLKVVAEGVETEAQLDFLREHACDEMQGFLFARPMPAADCARALTEGWRLPRRRTHDSVF